MHLNFLFSTIFIFSTFWTLFFILLAIWPWLVVRIQKVRVPGDSSWPKESVDVKKSPETQLLTMDFFKKRKKKILKLNFLSLLTLKLVSTPITLVEMTLTFFIWTVGDNMGPYRVNILWFIVNRAWSGTWLPEYPTEDFNTRSYPNPKFWDIIYPMCTRSSILIPAGTRNIWYL